MIGFATSIAAITHNKATGLAAVSGGLLEVFVTWGIATMLIAQVTAIIFLVRGLERKHLFRNIFALVSIGLSILMVGLIAGFAWLSWIERRHS